MVYDQRGWGGAAFTHPRIDASTRYDLIHPVDRLIPHLPREKKEGTFRLVQCGSRPVPFGSQQRQELIDILCCQESGVGFLMEQNISGTPGDGRFLRPQGRMLHPDPFPDAI